MASVKRDSSSQLVDFLSTCTETDSDSPSDNTKSVRQLC